MRRPHIIIGVVVIGLALVAGVHSCGDSLPGLAPDQIKGAWLAETGTAPLDSDAGQKGLERLRDLGVTTVAIGPEVQMPDITRPGLVYGEQDEALRRFLRRAKATGLGVFMLPRIESPQFFLPPHPWRADIGMADPADWPKFHEDFAKMVRHYGKLAREEGVTIFGLGLEYRATAGRHPDAWRMIAKAAKEAFQGPITYSANWDDFAQITWWDAVDYIGIGAYFELLDDGRRKDDVARTTLPKGTLKALCAGWEPIKIDLKALSDRYGRPIFFTEVGYTTFADTGYYPWRWQQSEAERRPIDPDQQALCYAALFKSFAGVPWWKGVCMWRFFTDPSAVPDWDYSPQGRPAEKVLRETYRK